MLLFILLIAIIIIVGYIYVMYKKNDMYNVPEIADIKKDPYMPAINTSFFLAKEREFKELGGIKIGDFSITEIAYANFHRGYLLEDDNIYAVVSQRLPNPLQKYLGMSDKPYISFYSVFDNGSDLESTTRENIEKEDTSQYRHVHQYEDLPLIRILEKHKIQIDIMESKGVTELKLTADDFFKHMKRGLRIDMVHRATNGYETKADLENIMTKLGLDPSKKASPQERNTDE